MINEGPINSFLINGDVGPGSYNANFLETFLQTDTLRMINTSYDCVETFAHADSVALATSISFNEAVVYTNALKMLIGWGITENYDVETILSSKGTFLMDVVNNLEYSNTMSLAVLFSLTEGISFTGDAELDRNMVMAFVEALVIADSATTQLKAMFAIAETISSIDSLEAGFGYDFAEALGIEDILGIDSQAVLNILESFLNTDSLTFTARVFLSATEGLSITDILETKGTLLANFAEEIIIGGFIETPEGSFEAWTVNAESRAPWQYTNFPFNSFAMIDGNYYGSDESALFSLDGDTDDGENISAIIKSGLINMGTTQFKRIPRAYFGYTSDGQILFKTITTESGQKIERWYELTEKTADDTTNNRLKLARGVKSVYWQFEIVNVDGADFDFDEIKLMPTILKRRR